MRGEARRQEPVGHLFGPVEDLPHRGVVEGEGDGLPDALVPKRRVWLLDVHRVDECAIRRALHQLDAGPAGQVVRRLIGPDRVEVHHVDLAARQHELLRADVGNDPDQDAVQVPVGPSAPVRRVALEHDELIFLRLHGLERPGAVDVRGEPGPPVIRIAGVRLPVDEDFGQPERECRGRLGEQHADRQGIHHLDLLHPAEERGRPHPELLDAVERQLDRFGVQRRPVVELHPRPQLERVGGQVRR